MEKRNKRIIVWLSVVIVLLVALLTIVWLWRGPLQAAIYQGGIGSQSLAVPPPGFKVAIVADQGINANSWKVMELIRDEGADMAIVPGDFAYNESNASAPELWDEMVTAVLGADYPLFALQGNHDAGQWGQYQALLEARLARIPEAVCTGDLGIKSACSYKGLFFLLTLEGTEDAYYQGQLAQSDSLWKICSWHKNQRAMQMGGKADDVGWGPYEECRKGGAFIVTGHEHSYSRTKTLSDMSKQTVDSMWSDPSLLRVGANSSFVAVVGLGGKSIRNQNRCLPTTYPYGCNEEWASVYTSNQGAKYGVLFIEFNVDGEARKANGYFKNIDGEIIDTFTLMADAGGVPAPASEVLIPEGANWKYLDDGSDQGTAWRSSVFDDSNWRSGPAQLGYGDGDEATVVSFGPDSNRKYTTTYFRYAFDVAEADLVAALSLAMVSDDGGVVYLNGEEVFRNNMPSGSISSTTFASQAIGGADESFFERKAVFPALLREGTNVMAVEIHQANFTSSDISFDFTMDMVREVVVSIPTLSPIPTYIPTLVPSVVSSPSPSQTPVTTISPSPSPSSGITSAEMFFEEKQFFVKPGDILEIPFRVTVRGWGIADIIARAIFKIADITLILRSFIPVFE